MNTMFRNVIIIAALSVLVTFACFSQQDTESRDPVRIILTDGSELIGTITGEDSESYTFTTVGDITITIPKNQVRRIEPLSGKIVGGEYIRYDPNNSRLFFSPTARSLRAGQGYFSAYQIFFPFVGIGIADLITVGGGISLVPGLSNQIFYLAPKITPYQRDNLSAAAGLLYINSTARSSDGVGIYYAMGTYGEPDKAITLGAGWGFYGSDIANKPVFILGGELRLSNSFKFITENWIPPDSDVVIVSFGLRFLGENLAADLGFVYPAGSDVSGFPLLPWLGFAYNFGI